MITEDSLRTLLAGEDLPPSVSPAAVRLRARTRRRNRRAGVVAGVALALPSLLIGLSRVPLLQGKSAGAGLPVAFGGDGEPLPLRADGTVALRVPGLVAWVDSEALCWGPNGPGDPEAKPGSKAYDEPGECLVAAAAGVNGNSMGGGVIGSFSNVPVVRADFIDGGRVAHAQVVGFARHPQWRTLTAAVDWPQSDADRIVVHGWDSKGNLVLAFGCASVCPAPSGTPVPQLAPDPADRPAPAAKSAVPIGGTVTLLPDQRVAVLPGADAWPTTHGVCVGNDNSSQCVTDGDTAVDDGFAIGGGVGSTILDKPVSRAEFTVNGVAVPAGVVEFASHPQWRVVIANVKVSTWAGNHVVLRGWDAAGKLIVDSDPDQSVRSIPPSTGTTTPVR